MDKILYYIGGIIVFLGINILLAQHWQTLTYSTKILATIGSGIAAYITGILFSREKKTSQVSTAFYLVSMLSLLMGLHVVFNHLGFDVSKLGPQTLISGTIFTITFFSYLFFRSNFFALASILFGTYFFFGLTGLLYIKNPYIFPKDFYHYRLLTIGLSYILLAYAFTDTQHSSLSGFLYGLGIIGFLGAALMLGGFRPDQNIFWELIFPVLAFGTIFFSVVFKSKTFLVFGTLFLIIYIFKISSEYFSESLGWPLVLVISGLSIIIIAYLSIKLKKKYLTK